MAISADESSRPRSRTISLQAAAFPENALCDMTFAGKFIFPLKLLKVLKVEYANLSTLSGREVVEIIGKVAKIKERVTHGKVVNLKGRKKSMSPQLRVEYLGQMCLLLLIVLLSTSQVAAQAKKESDEIGSCRFDMTSLASLSCVELGGIWRPPSMPCCNALLYAIDSVPIGSDRGACCLCRYIRNRYSEFALATSYVMCKGRDSHVVTQWTSIPNHCYQACQPRDDASPAHKDFLGKKAQRTDSSSYGVLWVAAVAGSFAVILLVWFCYHWWRKPAANSFELRPSNIQHRGLTSEARGESWPSRRHSSAQRRTSSSKGSPNG